jgi:HNH endonuclease
VISAEARNLVRARARDHCEYCLLDQRHSHLRHHVEHIVAKQHGGLDDLDNLALACHRCNLCKGPNLTGVDPQTRSVFFSKVLCEALAVRCLGPFRLDRYPPLADNTTEWS